jgi:hypothetical protein
MQYSRPHRPAGPRDRPLIAAEQRAIVTNDVVDFQTIHDRLLAAGEAHCGMVFTFDAKMPRTRAAIPRWIEALSDLLATHPRETSLRNRVLHLP